MSQPNEWNMSRREALGVLGVAAATCLSGCGKESKEKDAKKGGIALQLYTMRDPAKQDLPGTLKKIREMGWEYVQWSGIPGMPAEKIREALDTAGLKAVAAHCGVEAFENDFDKEVKFWKTVGVQYVGPGGMMKDCTKSLEAWLRGAKRLDVLGAKLRAVRMGLTFHNHSGEFGKFPDDPRCKLDILYEATSPENLFAELDTAWVQVGGADPAAYIRKYKNRCRDIHVKDLAAKKNGVRVHFTPLGKGVLNWPDIFAAGREAGIEWYVYEQDTCDGDPFGCAQTSYEFLKQNVK